MNFQAKNSGYGGSSGLGPHYDTSGNQRTTRNTKDFWFRGVFLILEMLRDMDGIYEFYKGIPGKQVKKHELQNCSSNSDISTKWGMDFCWEWRDERCLFLSQLYYYHCISK